MRRFRGGDDKVGRVWLFRFDVKRGKRRDARDDFNAWATKKLLDSPSRERGFSGDDDSDHAVFTQLELVLAGAQCLTTP